MIGKQMTEKQLLLDTHVVIWFFDGRNELSSWTVESIEKAAARGELLVSAITIWEIARLVTAGRVTFQKPLEQWISDLFESPGLHLVPLSPEISCQSCKLPGFHKDPVDRIIVATSLITQAKLVTRDRQIIEYKPMKNLIEVV